MKVQYHIATSTIVSGIVYILFKSWSITASALIAGIFIDLDHFIDYFREHGWSLNIKRFFQVCKMSQFNKIVLFLHGWEWVLLLISVSWISEWNPWITGATIGISHHLVFDAFANSSNFKSYSLLWRWSNNFDFDIVFSKLTENKYKYRHLFNQ